MARQRPDFWHLFWLFIAFGHHSGGQDCNEAFKPGTVCPLDIDNVLDIDGYTMETEQECQYSCFRDKSCSHFTFFRKEEVQKCVLFRGCDQLSECRSCFTGPVTPSLGDCMEDSSETTTGTDPPLTSGNPDITSTQTSVTLPPGVRQTLELSPRDRFNPGLAEGEVPSPEPAKVSQSNTNSQQRPQTESRIPKQLDENEGEDDSDDDDDDDDTMSISGVDDGLLNGEEDPIELPEQTTRVGPLIPDVDEPEEVDEGDDQEEAEEAFPDEYFDDQTEEVNPTNTNPNGTVTRRGPPFFHCIMGGYGPRGAIPSVSHLVPSQPRVPRFIPSLPLTFPLGLDGMYSVMMTNTIVACSPGSTASTSRLFRAFGTTAALRAGGCFAYSNPIEGWVPMGSPMNTYRGGAGIARMGRFLVATGGHSFPTALNSIEVLNTRNPRRWRTMNKLVLPRPTFDHCVVAVNKTAVLMTGGFGQEAATVMLDLKGKKWEAMEPMKQPRRKHSCVKAKVNGREGVIVAGGASDAVPALASLEFYDLEKDNWLSLGRMRQGRRFPGIFVLAGNLVIAGGETTDPLGRTVIMDNMETLRKKTWRPVKQRMAEPRSRFASLRIPRTFF